jgi:hypothetical protein
MAILEAVMENARNHVRDFPVFFSTTTAQLDLATRSFKLPHNNVSANGLVVWATNGTATVDGVTGTGASADDTHFVYVLDERNGLLRITAPPTGTGFPAGAGANVEGYYYEWLADSELRYFTTMTIAEHAFHRQDFDFEAISDVEREVITLGAAAEAMYSLLVEYSRDIDVNTPQAISIPASQRFRQVEQLLFGQHGLMDRYKEKAHMLNVGLDKIEMIVQRRVSRMTNRLVPIYTHREYDDISVPRRVFPRIDIQAPTTPPASFTPARQITAGELDAEPNP